MPKLTLIGLYFWICLAQKVVSGEDLYHKVEGELVLKPDKSTVPDSITSILWKHGKNKVAEWDKDFDGILEIYAGFKGRTTLDKTTGELRISGLNKTDSGVYSVEFNSKLLDKTYTLSVIKAVPKPIITSSCNANLTSCTLTCEGNTTDAEPVTYSWKVGEGAWEVGGKLFNVFKSDTGKSTNGYKYICKLKNAVSGEVSEPVGEVFGPEPSNTSAIVGGVIGTVLALVAIVITGFLIWEKKKPEYLQDTWIEFFSKFFSRLCGDAGNNQNSVAPDTVYHTVGDVQVTNLGASGVLSGVAMDTVYSAVGEKSSRDYSMNQNNNNQPTNTAKGSDVVQPEQGKGNADKAEKGKGKEDLYHKVGGEILLTPDKLTVTDSITSIVWKHGECYVADWDKDLGGLGICGAFKGRTTLDQNTGELRISGLKKTDSGVYSVEFNRKLLDKTYKLSVIKGSVLLNEDTVKYDNGKGAAEENSAL